MLRNIQGYATLVDPQGGIKECDTFTCEHCNAIIHLPVNKQIEQVGDFCRSCMKLICANCAQQRTCSPFLKKLDYMESRRTYV